MDSIFSCRTRGGPKRSTLALCSILVHRVREPERGILWNRSNQLLDTQRGGFHATIACLACFLEKDGIDFFMSDKGPKRSTLALCSILVHRVREPERSILWNRSSQLLDTQRGGFHATIACLACFLE